MALIERAERGGFHTSHSRAPRPHMETIVLRPPKMGVVAFQNKSCPTAGMACVGQKAPEGFERRTDLASDVLWISEQKDSISAQNFRPVSFLRSSLTQIAGDLGVILDSYDGIKAVASVVANTRDLLAQAYPWRDFSEDWSYESMPIALAKILPTTGEILASMESPLIQAHQAYSFVPDAQSTGQNQAIFTLRTNRLRFAQYILSTKTPSSSWRSIPDFTKAGLPIDYLLNEDMPSLSEVTIEFSTSFADAVTPALVAFGSGAKFGKQPIRKWVTQLELAWLVEHANVHVQSAYLSEGSLPLAQAHQLPELLTSDPPLSLSISAGLVAECHWTGISLPVTVRRAGNSATARYAKLFSPAAVWLRAADRAYTFQMAKVVAQKGFSVTGYGYGGVSFYAPKNALEELVELAQEVGACHPCIGSMQGFMSGLPVGEER